jgi:ATP-dependent protease ClpP protease subunit
MKQYVNQTSPGTAEIYLYDEFGPDYWGLCSAKAIATQLSALGAVTQINVRINSPGGDIIEAAAIYTLLKDHAAQVIVDIDGMALSCAGWVAQAGDVRRAAENAIVMLHDPMMFMGFSNAMQLRKEAEILDKMKATIVGVFSARTGRPTEGWDVAMLNETWYTAQEAKDVNLIDEITPNKQVSMCLRPGRPLNVPDRFAGLFAPAKPDTPTAANEGSATPRRNAHLLRQLALLDAETA